MNSVFKKILIASIFTISISLSSCGNQNSNTPITPDTPETPTEPEGEITYKEASQTYTDYISNNIYAFSSTPTIGNSKLLVIPVWFSNSSTFLNQQEKNKVREDIEKAYFGSEGETGWHSVASFYKNESGGKLNLTGTVSEWYEISQSYADLGVDNDDKTVDLVEAATEWYFASHDDNRLDYDSNQDAYLDGVMLIYAAPDYASGSSISRNYGGYDNLWAYCFWIQNINNQDKTNPGPNVFFWASYDFMYDSKNPEAGKYGCGDNSHTKIDAHTYIHEMGHVFGLEDYYDYSNQYSPAAGFSMQDENIGGHDPFSTYAFGWSKAHIPTKSEVITLKSFQETHEIIILSPSFNSYNSPFDEYLILELYTPDNLNELDTKYLYQAGYGTQGPNATGIRLWHVDARLAYFLNEDDQGSINQLTSNALDERGVTHAFSNTYYSEEAKDYVSILGKKYANFNVLQLLRNDNNVTYKSSDTLSKNDLFMEGDSFKMSDYKSQFVNGIRLNNNKNLGFEFSIDEIKNNEAKITITKL